MTGTALSGKKYKVYPEYKNTDEVWLGDVPTHWRDIKINRLSLIKRGASPRPIDDPKYFDADGEYAWVRIADVTACDTYLETTPQRLSTLGASLSVKLEPNELFLSIAGTVGKPCINKIKACIHDGFVYFPEYKENIKFLYYIFAAGEAYKGLGKFGTQLNLNTETVGGIKVGLPCLEEQQKIASFLDHETAKIDTLIAKQEKLIELLKEKRQAVISHAVTKGLNPDAPMKDSGVEWLGEVPEHWGKVAFKQFIKTRKGVAFSTSDFCDSGIRVVKASDIKHLSLRKSDVFLPETFTKKYPKAYLNQGNIILSTVGSTPDVKNSAVGQIAMVPKELDGTLLNQNTVVFDPTVEAIDRNYLFLLLQTRAYRDHLDLHAHGTANQASLNVADMLDFKCFIPSIDEQHQIAEYLKQFLRTISDLETKAISAIELMRERKTALISAAVTGKIDVRDWQPQGV